MKNKLLKQILFLGLLPLSFTLKSCKTTENTSTESKTDVCQCTPQTQEKHVIELTLDNWERFIDLRPQITSGTYSSIYFFGSLSYAYYDNVVVTHGNGTTVYLTVGGYGYYYNTYITRPTIKSISGSVIYWL